MGKECGLMYICKETGLTEYESFNELLNADIDEMTENKNRYFIQLKPEQFYDNTVWVVDKQTKSVSFIHFTEYLINFMDKVTPVCPDVILALRKAS